MWDIKNMKCRFVRRGGQELASRGNRKGVDGCVINASSQFSYPGTI